MKQPSSYTRVRLTYFEIHDTGLPTHRHGKPGFLESYFDTRGNVTMFFWIPEFFPTYGGEIAFTDVQVEAIKRYIRENPRVLLTNPRFEPVPLVENREGTALYGRLT